LLARFSAANTTVVGVSVDSQFCHKAWAESLGGVTLPLLADFNPKGAVASAFGVYLDDNGITDRATVIVDKSGVIRHKSSVGVPGKRDISEIAALCEGVNAEHG
jgi:alkyl hydroperoxide reductase subunit AhpC